MKCCQITVCIYIQIQIQMQIHICYIGFIYTHIMYISKTCWQQPQILQDVAFVSTFQMRRVRIHDIPRLQHPRGSPKSSGFSINRLVVPQNLQPRHKKIISRVDWIMCIYICIYILSHPQIDGKVNHHWICRDFLFHLFGDDYIYIYIHIYIYI